MGGAGSDAWLCGGGGAMSDLLTYYLDDGRAQRDAGKTVLQSVLVL